MPDDVQFQEVDLLRPDASILVDHLRPTIDVVRDLHLREATVDLETVHSLDLRRFPHPTFRSVLASSEILLP